MGSGREYSYHPSLWITPCGYPTIREIEEKDIRKKERRTKERKSGTSKDLWWKDNSAQISDGRCLCSYHHVILSPNFPERGRKNVRLFFCYLPFLHASSILHIFMDEEPRTKFFTAVGELQRLIGFKISHYWFLFSRAEGWKSRNFQSWVWLPWLESEILGNFGHQVDVLMVWCSMFLLREGQETTQYWCGSLKIGRCWRLDSQRGAFWVEIWA